MSQSHPDWCTRALRKCFGRFAPDVTVVTAKCDEQIVGITANLFSSISLTSPLVLWSADRKSRSFASFPQTGYFAINVGSDAL